MIFCCTSDVICRFGYIGRSGYSGRFGYGGSDVHLGTVGCRGRADFDRYIRILLQIVPNDICNGTGTHKISFAIQSAVSCDCSVIGEGHAVLHSQGGVFRYGQRFAPWNLYILLNGWISIDCASISLEDNAAPTVPPAFVTDTACNNQGMTVRSGCEAAARTTTSIADSGSMISASCGDTAAADGDVATRILRSAADSGC